LGVIGYADCKFVVFHFELHPVLVVIPLFDNFNIVGFYQTDSPNEPVTANYGRKQNKKHYHSGNERDMGKRNTYISTIKYIINEEKE
jgi:hypothetical protein